MNYIYDISLNLKPEIYDFYEWKKEDKIIFILKIPIFKIDKELFYNLYFNDITVDKKFLINILNKTDVYYPNSIKKLKYCSIFSDGENAIAISFNEDGKNIKKSILSLEENEEIIEFSKYLKTSFINFKVNKIIKVKECFLTRSEKEKRSRASEYIQELYKNKKFTKLKYLFYEVYNEEEKNLEVVYSKLNNVIKNDNIKTEKILKIVDLIENRKNNRKIAIK